MQKRWWEKTNTYWDPEELNYLQIEYDVERFAKAFSISLVAIYRNEELDSDKRL
jgi:hypothetical protein